ncbi:MAG: energy transducer TonB [Micropepsaceae bacterium]
MRIDSIQTILVAALSFGILAAASSRSAAEPPAAASALAWIQCEQDEGYPGFTKAELSFKPLLKYPKKALEDWSEGWALLEYAIRPDGTVRDVAVVDSLGPEDFVKTSVKAAAHWRYKPATRNGVPVEQFLHQSSILFLIEGSGREAAHGAFVRKYESARRLLADKHSDEAIATLESAFKARLNLYEEAMGSFALAIAYAQKSEWQRALSHIRHATIEQGRHLEKPLQAHAFALQVELEARNSSYHEAECAFKSLRLIDPPSAAGTSEPAKIIDRIHAVILDPKPLVFEAKLSALTGEVKSFRLSCTGAAHEAAVDTETQWDVPANAGDCILRVYGAPGATLRVVEEW